ncbi:MAG: hypothetical protein KTR33_04185 [Gammaproteobacteria bacterium]|nr:hypothetical protein [Gammaproteobacteria bacterium]
MLKQPAPQSRIHNHPDFLISSAPFQRSCSIHHFFAGGDRGQILENVIRDLQQAAVTGSTHTATPINVSGEVGSGKTMLGLVLSHRLKNKFNVVRYEHARLNAEQLIKHLLIEFCPLQTRQLIAQLTDDEESSVECQEPGFPDLVKAISESGQIKPVVLLIDSPEIDDDSWPVLQQLNNLQVDGKSVVQTVVFEEIPAPSHVLTQAATQKPTQAALKSAAEDKGTKTEPDYLLRRLTLSEIHAYLQHQMLLFDYSRRDNFTREMAYFVADRTGGVFRDMNSLARNACTIAGVQSHSNVSLQHLLQAGLPTKPDPRESRTLSVIKNGGVHLALTVASVVATLVMVFLTRF